eukprot:gene13998-15461_t
MAQCLIGIIGDEGRDLPCIGDSTSALTADSTGEKGYRAVADTITEPSSVTKEAKEQSAKESGLVTNQTEAPAINKEIADSMDKRDNQTISKPVL